MRVVIEIELSSCGWRLWWLLNICLAGLENHKTMQAGDRKPTCFSLSDMTRYYLSICCFICTKQHHISLNDAAVKDGA